MSFVEVSKVLLGLKEKMELQDQLVKEVNLQYIFSYIYIINLIFQCSTKDRVDRRDYK